MKAIHIKKMSINTTIGVYEYEKIIKQQLHISIKMEYDFGAAMQSDNLCDTLDYSAIGQDIKEILENNAYELIERVLAVISHLLEERYKIKRYAIEVEKPSALENAEGISVIYDNWNN